MSAGLIGVRLWKNVGEKVRKLWFGGRCGVAVCRLGPSFPVMRVKKAHGVFGEVLGSELRTARENMPWRFPPRQPSFGRAHDGFQAAISQGNYCERVWNRGKE